MKLAYPLLNEPIVFEEEKINVLVIENPIELRNSVTELQLQIDGEDGQFVLSDCNQILPFATKAVFITDPLNLQVNSRKVSGKIDQLAYFVSNDHFDEVQDILFRLNALAAEICTGIEYEVTYSPLESGESLMKIMDFHIDEEGLSLPEKILEYMKVSRALLNKEVFLFLNLKAFLSKEELTLLYRSMQYEKLHVLLIEDVQRRGIPEYEKTTIVDEDLCIL